MPHRFARARPLCLRTGVAPAAWERTKVSGSRRRLDGMVASLVTLVACSLAVLVGSGPGAGASGPTTSLTLQTMDSCKRGLDGAGNQRTGGTRGGPRTV